MSTDPSSGSLPSSAAGSSTETEYFSLEDLAELAGVRTVTVLHYHEQGFIPRVEGEGAEHALFDGESLRKLRRIEHLRSEWGINDSGLKLVLALLQEVEELRQERRHHWSR